MHAVYQIGGVVGGVILVLGLVKMCNKRNRPKYAGHEIGDRGHIKTNVAEGVPPEAAALAPLSLSPATAFEPTPELAPVSVPVPAPTPTATVTQSTSSCTSLALPSTQAFSPGMQQQISPSFGMSTVSIQSSVESSALERLSFLPSSKV